MNNLTIPIFSRYTIPEEKANDWSLVLTALDIDHAVVPGHWGWHVLVSPDDKERAELEILSYERENNLAHKLELTPPFNVTYYSTVIVSTLLLAFHGLTVFFDGKIDFFKAGHASSLLIQQGQWWRSVTALTLHGDAFHVISNVILGSIFALALSRQIGQGLCWFLILLSGIMGNICNAFIYDSIHLSIGASTAVFGAVGLVAALQFFVHKQSRMQKAWAPLGAALALFGFLGTGENSDILAHFLGLASGVILGVSCGFILKRTGIPNIGFQKFLSIISLLFIIYSWSLAFKAY